MLHKRHTFQHTLIFNLSDRKYDYEKFDNKIVEVGFPDHYSPPLDVLMDIVLRIEKWIRDNPRNVAVVHCVVCSGRWHVCLMTPCFLGWQRQDWDCRGLLAAHVRLLRNRPGGVRVLRYETLQDI